MKQIIFSYTLRKDRMEKQICIKIVLGVTNKNTFKLSKEIEIYTNLCVEVINTLILKFTYSILACNLRLRSLHIIGLAKELKYKTPFKSIMNIFLNFHIAFIQNSFNFFLIFFDSFIYWICKTSPFSFLIKIE